MNKVLLILLGIAIFWGCSFVVFVSLELIDKLKKQFFDFVKKIDWQIVAIFLYGLAIIGIMLFALYKNPKQ